MASFAKVSLLGNLGADPETKYTPSGTMVVELRIAVNPRPRGQQAQEEARPTWYRVSAWDRLADSIDKLTQNQHLKKGSQLFVEGKLEPREFTGNDGQTRVSYDVTMTDFQFVGDRRDGEGASAESSGSSGGYSGGGGSAGGGGGNNRRQTFNDSAPNDLDDIPF